MEVEPTPIMKSEILNFLTHFPLKPDPQPCYSRPSDIDYKNLSSKFVTPEPKNFNTQYCHFYFVRLMTMKPKLSSQLLSLNYNPISTLTLPKNQTCCMIGILYKEMKLKPSILQRVGGIFDNNSTSLLSTYTSDDDVLYLEDENGKVRLDLSQSKESIKNLCSGLVAGLSGKYDGKIFYVNDVIFCGSHSLKEKMDSFSMVNYINEINENDKFVAMISGLNIDGSQEDINYSLNWLKEVLYGNMNNEKMINILSRICRVLIAGNSIKKEGFMDNFAFVGAAKAQELYHKANKEVKKSMIILDNFLNEVSKTVAIDILSGDNEPNTRFFPYQPLNKYYFEKSYKNSCFNAVTNPYYFELEGIKILGTSGHNIQDLRKSCLENQSDIELLEATLKWGHIAPTAPETIRYL